jgi:cell division protein FtsQ
VLWGSVDRGARKAAVLAVLVTRRAAVYDVSAPDAPTTRR